MPTALDIANAALREAGRNPVTNLDYDPLTPTPEGMLAVYLAYMFRQIASSRQWPETTKTTKLKKGRKTKYGRFVFRLPSDCWNVLEVKGLPPGAWKVSRMYPLELRATIRDVTIKYARNIYDVSDIDELLSDEFANTLIKELAKFIKTRLDENFTIVH